MPNIVWDLIYRDHGVARGLNDVAGAHDKAERRAKAFKVAAAVGFLVVGAAAIKFGRESVRAYSESENAQKALGFAFSKFPALADTNQAALQKLNSELQKKTRFDDDNIASGQAVLAQFKLTGKQITETTPLLVDYAARTGKDIPAAAQDVGKALLGNAKALKNVGIFYKSTGDAGKDFTNVTALMREKVGGFADLEGKTASGRLAILSNQFGELQEQAGRHLVPALSAGVEVLTDLVVVVGENADVIVPLVAGVGGLTGAIWLGHKAAKAYAVVQGVMGAAMASNSRVATGFAAVVGKAGPWGLAIGAGVTVLGLFAGKQALAEREARGFTDALTFQKGALDDNSRQTLIKKLADEGALDVAKRAGVAESDYVRALLQGGPVRDRLINQLYDTEAAAQASAETLTGDTTAQLDLAESAAKAAGNLKLEGGAFDASKRAAELAAGAYEATSTATEDLGTQQRNLRTKLDEAKTALQGVLNKLTILKTGALDQETANLAWEESIDGVTASAKENGRSLSDNTTKGRTNRRAIIDAILALNDKTTADFKEAAQSKDSAKATKVATGRYKDNRAALIEVAKKAGLSEDAVHDMLKEYSKNPDKLETEVKADTKKAREEIRKLRAALALVKSREAWINFSTNAAAVAKAYGVSLKVFRGSTAAQGGRGFDTGGYTGNLPPGTPAGIVHGDEQVIPSRSRRRFEAKYPGYLKHITEYGDVPGYRAGGLVRHINVGTRGTLKAPDYSAIANKLAYSVANRVGSILAPRFAGAGGGAIGSGGVGGSQSGFTRFHGGLFTTLAATNLRLAERQAGVAFRVFQGGWRPRTSYSGTSHAGDAVDTQASARVIRAIRGVGWASGDRTGLGNWASHAHSVPGPNRGRARGSAVWQYQDYLRRGGARQGLRSPWGLERGGLLTARVAERGPERILSARQTNSFERMVRVAETNGGRQVKVEQHFHFPNYVGSRDELRQALVEMNRRGQLEVIKQR